MNEIGSSRFSERCGTDGTVEAGVAGQNAPRNVLLLCNFESSHIGTVRDHLSAFRTYSSNRVCIADAPSAAKFDFDFAMFDVIVLHYSLIISSARHVPPGLAEKIRAFRGYKILFIQDEYRWVDRTAAAIADLGVDLIYSVVNEEALDRIYHHPSISHVRRKVTLTGFVPEELTRRAVPAFAERPIDVGYRARRVPAWLGGFAQEKFWIGQRFKQEAEKRGLRCDIEHTESRRLYGERWISFVGNCKAMLGTESGASYVDFTGAVQPMVDAFEQDNPSVGFDEIQKRFLRDGDGDIVIHVISPRCFEAAAMRTLMILYPGDYSGVLEPWRHYVPLERDHSNFDEVVAVLRDPGRAGEIIDNAYREVALNRRYGFRTMVEEFDRDVAANAPPPPDTPEVARDEAALADLERRTGRYYKYTRRVLLKIRLTVYTAVHWVIMKTVRRDRQDRVIAAIKSAARRIGLP